MVQIFPLFETDSKDLFFHLFPKVHIYKIVKNYIKWFFYYAINTGFISVRFCIRKYIKNGGINFGLSRLAIFVSLGILSYTMVKQQLIYNDGWKQSTIKKKILSNWEMTQASFEWCKYNWGKVELFNFFFNWCLLIPQLYIKLLCHLGLA